MELLFFYINQSDSKFIEKRGFNFSPNYHYYVEYSESKYVLKQKQCRASLPANFFDSEECITNVTAIVGENGSGKTTLLNKIESYGAAVKNQSHQSEYNKFFEEKYECDKAIAIYKEDNEIVCYHNIDGLESEAEVKIVYLYEGSEELKEIVRENRGFENISKICISNSAYALEGGVSAHQSIGEIHLNINSLRTFKNIFYRKKIKINKDCAGGYYEYFDILCNSKKENDFQQILDLLYLQYINSEGVRNILSNSINNTLEIRFQSFIKIMEKYNDFVSESQKDLTLKNYEDMVLNKILSKFDRGVLKKNIFSVIYINLLFEIISYLRITNYDSSLIVTNMEELVDYIKVLITELKKKKCVNAEYFIESFEEINEYEKILSTCKMYPCTLPLEDRGYVSYMLVEYGTTEYYRFLNAIAKSVFERQYTYVLKYINIGGLKLASGERALLNIFSWLHLVPYFNYISNDVVESLRDNVLLLIDEIDLYCHPLWQQKLIFYLLEEIKAEYSGKKVQVIFTTHSPIVLSDIPKRNVIFLKRVNGKCCIDESDNHYETFGANIYKLFDDSFFLGEKGQIGEFARKKIQQIIEKIKPDINVDGEYVYREISEEEIYSLEQEIALIGESILQDKLYEMLYKCRYRLLDLKDRKIKIYQEKIRRIQSGEDE